MTGRWGSDESGRSASKVRVAAGVAAAMVGIIIGLPMCGLGLVWLMFVIADGQPSSATVRLTAVGLALIVLGIACIVVGVRARGWIVRASRV